MSKIRLKEVTEVRKRLLGRLGIPRTTLDYRIKVIKDNCPIVITIEYATYLYARQENEKLDFLLPEKMDKLNAIINDIRKNESYGSHSPLVSKISPPLKKEKQKAKDKIKFIKFRKDDIKIPNLPKDRINEAESMSELYYYLYIFENSLRYYVIEIMENNYTSNWWTTKVDTVIQDNVKKIKENEKKKWLWRDEPHNVFFTSMGELIGIITKYWVDFKPIFGSKKKVEWFCDPIKDIRNGIAHNNRLSKRKKEILLLAIKEWFDHIDRLNP